MRVARQLLNAVTLRRTVFLRCIECCKFECLFYKKGNFSSPVKKSKGIDLFVCYAFSPAGDGDDYVFAALKDDSIIVRVKLRSGVFETEIKPFHSHADAVTSSSSASSAGVSGGLSTTRFDDDRWHKLLITREAREVSIHV
jgi:hypothetical protein